MTTYCHTTSTKEKCLEDSTCTWLDNKPFHPFSAFDKNSDPKLMDPELCASIDGTMIENKTLERYDLLCNNDVGLLPGNTSSILNNSSPDNNFKEYEKCWTCVKATENLDAAQSCLADKDVFSQEAILTNMKEVIRTVNTIVSKNDSSTPSDSANTPTGLSRSSTALNSMSECMKNKSMIECMT